MFVALLGWSHYGMMVVALWGLSPTKQMQREPSVNLYRIMFNCSVADPERFDVDPDPTFYMDADPDLNFI